MKKEFINEAKRFQKLAGIITESQLNENGAAYFEKIWDMYMKHVMEDLRSGDITDEESESLQVMANNATYSTMDELINSINDIEAEIAEVFDDTQGAYFEELIMILNDICDKINYPNKVEFLKALIEFEADRLDYNEEDQADEWGDLLDRINNM
jgi:hypothetical protein